MRWRERVWQSGAGRRLRERSLRFKWVQDAIAKLLEELHEPWIRGSAIQSLLLTERCRDALVALRVLAVRRGGERELLRDPQLVIDGLHTARDLLEKLLLASIEHQRQQPALDLVEADSEQEAISDRGEILRCDERTELADDQLDELLVREPVGSRDAEVVGDVGVSIWTMT